MTAPAPGPAGPGLSTSRRLWIRLGLSPLVLGVVLGILWLHASTGSPLPTDLLMALFGAGAALELAVLLSASGRPSHRWIAVVGAGLLAGVGLLAPEDGALRGELRGVLVAAALLAALLRHLYDTSPRAVESIALSLVPVVYVGLFFSFLREVAFGPDGAERLAWVVLVSKASDTGGWLVGKPFGRHKMVPSVSPGKSWEGFAGGLALSVVAAVLLPGPLGLDAEAAWSVPTRVLFGLVVAVASILAGVTASGWKRRLGAKDSSRLIPEMGGLLDQLDSLLLAGPAAYAWYALLPPG